MKRLLYIIIIIIIIIIISFILISIIIRKISNNYVKDVKNLKENGFVVLDNILNDKD